MSEEKYDIERIDRYLKGMLEDKELQEFESQMGADPDLMTEVALQKDIMIGSEAYFDEQLKGKLRQIENEPEEVSTTGKQFFFRPWQIGAIAASLLLFITLGYLFFFQTADPEKLYLSYYEPYPNIVNPIKRSESKLNDDALSYYEQGDYTTAASIFESELIQQPNEDYLLFYWGLCNLELGELNQATSLLKKIPPAADSRFYSPAQWYLALAYLKADNVDQAKIQLQTIVESGGDYKNKAQELLDDL